MAQFVFRKHCPWERVMRLATYAFLVWSVIFLVGALNSLVFLEKITIENRLDTSVLITPIGKSRGGIGRYVLPLRLRYMPLFPSQKRAGFFMAPGQQLELLYNSDDVLLSEIVVEAEKGRLLLFDAEIEKSVDRAERLVLLERNGGDKMVSPAIRELWGKAQTVDYTGWVWLLLLVGPWIMYFLVRRKGYSGPRSP